MFFNAFCHHCGEKHDLRAMQKAGIKVESSTNAREEDTVSFRCPACLKQVDGALVTRS